MPNRIIKESICRSDSIDSLSWFEEVLFYRLIVVCDDFGRFDGRPAIIKGACFPLKDIRVEQIEKALDKLSTVGMVWRYSVEDRPFLQLTAWERHQQKRAKNSKYPAPKTACNQLISDDSRCPRESRIEKRETRIEKRETNAGAREVGEVRRFEDFLTAYPIDCNRYLTETVYCDLLLTGKVTEDELVQCAVNYAEACRILETSERYIKNAENFLKDRVFEKYLPGKYRKPTQQKPKNGFNNFRQNKYDFEQLEKKLLHNGGNQDCEPLHNSHE